MKHGYIGEFEIIDDHRAGKIVVNLTGRLNKCGVISPRFDVQLKDLEKWQNNLLPSCQFGFIVLTTSAGIMDHEEARRKHTGGKILGFFFFFFLFFFIFFYFNFYLFMIVTERERGRDTGRGRCRLHAPGARRGIRSRVSRIAP